MVIFFFVVVLITTRRMNSWVFPITIASYFLSFRMNDTTFAVIAIVAALVMFGVVVVTVATTMQLQQAEAAGCPTNNPAGNASKGRCFQG
jgi:hypothetical protein